MKKDIMKDLWKIIDTMNMYEQGLHNIKDFADDYIAEIRHTKSDITDIIIKLEMEDKR